MLIRQQCIHHSQFTGNASILFGKSSWINSNIPHDYRSDAVRFRVYDLIIRVAGSSDDAFRLAESSGFLVPILDEVNSDDILVQLNAIEMLKEVKHGMIFHAAIMGYSNAYYYGL